MDYLLSNVSIDIQYNVEYEHFRGYLEFISPKNGIFDIHITGEIETK